ncbi:MAG: hypothetical protein ACXV3E_05100 [Halobacteriota archaeon]
MALFQLKLEPVIPAKRARVHHSAKHNILRHAFGERVTRSFIVVEARAVITDGGRPVVIGSHL